MSISVDMLSQACSANVRCKPVKLSVHLAADGQILGHCV